MKQLTLVLYIAVALVPILSACNAGTEKKEDKRISNYMERPGTKDLQKKGLRDLTNSDDLKNILCQNWDNKEDASDIKNFQGSGELDMVNRGFSFFNDGTMVKNPRGEYKQGTWLLHDAQKPYIIEMKYADGTKDLYQLAKLEPKLLTLNQVNATNEKKLVEYKGEAIAHILLDKEPFHISNNGWRIQPSQAESETQIKERLKGCIHFFVLYYDQCIDANSEDVNFTGLPSCYKWYAGGIFIKKEKELAPNWINCFYNKKQAQEAYKMADQLLEKKYTWPKGERNWVKQNVYVLKQMEKNI